MKEHVSQPRRFEEILFSKKENISPKLQAKYFHETTLTDPRTQIMLFHTVFGLLTKGVYQEWGIPGGPPT